MFSLPRNGFNFLFNKNIVDDSINRVSEKINECSNGPHYYVRQTTKIEMIPLSFLSLATGPAGLLVTLSCISIVVLSYVYLYFLEESSSLSKEELQLLYELLIDLRALAAKSNPTSTGYYTLFTFPPLRSQNDIGQDIIKILDDALKRDETDTLYFYLKDLRIQLIAEYGVHSIKHVRDEEYSKNSLFRKLFVFRAEEIEGVLEKSTQHQIEKNQYFDECYAQSNINQASTTSQRTDNKYSQRGWVFFKKNPDLMAKNLCSSERFFNNISSRL